MYMLQFHISSFFLALFLLSVMDTMMFNPSHFFPKAKAAIMQVQRRATFSLGEYAHLWAK